MELRERAERLIKPQAPTAVPLATRSTGELARAEKIRANCHWLRGAMCLLAVICCGLSLFEEATVAHYLVLLFSLAGEAAIVEIYLLRVKLQNLRRDPDVAHAVSVFHSPSLCTMVLEMLVWIIQCPPRTNDRPDDWVARLDIFLIIRFYVLFLYATDVSRLPLFTRSIACLANIRFGNRLFVCITFMLEHLFVTLAAFVVGLVTLALFYAKAEGMRLGDSIFFCVSTASFVGIGDVSPATVAGRAIALGAFFLGVAVLCWIVCVVNRALSLSDAERNLYALFQSNKLCGGLPLQAARLIQRTWHLYLVNRDRRNAVSRQMAAFLFKQQVATFRRMRQELIYFEGLFLRSTRSFDDYLPVRTSESSRQTTPRTSIAATPTGTPRSQRPFPLFQEVRTKARLSRTMSMSGGSGNGGWSFRSRTGATTSAVAAPGLTEVEQRLSNLESTLGTLVANVAGLQGRLGLKCSVSV